MKLLLSFLVVRKLTKILPLIIFMLIAFSCNTSIDYPEGIISCETPHKGHNNYALLSGPVLGSGTVPNEDYYKKINLEYIADNIPFSELQLEKHFSIPDKVYATKQAVSGEYCDIYIPIKNISSDSIYAIGSSLEFFDNKGTPIDINIASNRMHGSAALSSQEGVIPCFFNVSSLAPEETGYITIMTDSFSKIDTIQIRIIYSWHEAAETNSSVLPLSYTYENSIITVTFKNTGKNPVYVGALHEVIGFDEKDVPLFITNVLRTKYTPHFDINYNYQLLNAGEIGTAIIEPIYFPYKSTITKILVYMDFEPINYNHLD